jgi:signal transduction histidine kinase
MATRGRRRLRISIRVKLALVIGCVATLIVITLTGIQAWFNSQRLWDGVNSQLLHTASLISSDVDSVVGNTMDELSVLSADPNVIDDFANTDTVRMGERLAAWLGHDPDLLNLAAIDRNGVVFATSQVGDTSLVGLSLRDERQVQTALVDGKPGIGEPRPGLASGQPVVPLAAPVVGRNGQRVGVLLAGLSLERLSSYMDRVAVGRDGYASLLTRDGAILTNPSRQRILTRAVGANQAVIGAREGRTIVVETLNAAGVRIIAAAAPIPAVGWIVQVQMPREEALEPIYAEIRRGVVIGIEMVLVSLFISGAAAAYLTRSIARLQASAERWASGDLLHQTRITSSDELGQLGRAFNEMAADLRDTIRHNQALLAQVQNERATLARVMDSMSDGLIGLDGAQRIRFCNGRASELLRVDLGALLGRPLADGLAESRQFAVDPEGADAAYRRLLAEADQRPTAEVSMVGPPRVDLLLESFPVTGTQGSAVGLLVHDVTADRDLARAKDELVSVVSHELRAPLASLTGFTELMLTRSFSEEQRSTFLETMLREGHRLTALINDFLDMQRMEIGRQPLRTEPTDVCHLLDYSIMAAGPDEGHPIALDVPRSLPTVTADPDRLQQVLTNLISNARKYSPTGGEIVIGARVLDECVEIAVSDHGLGLPLEAQAGLFKKFYRVDNRDHREIKGTGLGLAICKQIVEAHGGRIWASSPGLGQGTTFTFTVPLGAVPAGVYA